MVMVVTTEVTATDEQIRARWGWIWHSDKSLPVRSIQDVEIGRSLIARLLGLTQVAIASAGGSGSIKLSYLDLETATQLKAFLAHKGLGTAAEAGGEGPPQTDHQLRSVSFAELFRTQYTTAFVMALVALASLVAAFVAGPPALVGVLGAGAFLGFGVLMTWLGYGACASSISGGLLHLRQGVINLRTTNTPLRRLQVIKARSGPMFQLMGFEKVEYASAEVAVEKSERIRQVLSPAAEQGTVLQFSSSLLRIHIPAPLAMTGLGPLVVRSTIARAVVRSFVLLTVGGVLAAETTSIVIAVDRHHRVADPILVAAVLGLFAGALAASWVAISAAAGAVRSRRSGYSFGEDCFVLRDGFAFLRTTVVPLGKVQAVAVRQSPGQRMFGAATVALDVAGVSGTSSVTIDDVTTPVAESLAEYFVAVACRSALPDGV
jgi:membrane protein YdbS with pleckstrin-like domain